MSLIIENILRVAMHNILVKKKGVDYFNITVFPKFKYEINSKEEEFDIVQRSIDKKNEEKKYREKLGQNFPYLWYLDFMELLTILDNFWSIYFAELFNHPKNIKSDLISRLKSLRLIRNSIAHNRSILGMDINDIDASSELIHACVKVEYLYNYNEIVFNDIDAKKTEFIKLSQLILSQISIGAIISKTEIRTYSSQFASLAQALDLSNKSSDEFKEIGSLIERFNKLPRIPGESNKIKEFVKTNSLIQKIHQLQGVC